MADEHEQVVIPNSPPSTLGFGPRESADETRQAQHTHSNDTPTDVNLNAVVARSQTLTFDVLGKAFTSNQDRRDKMFDQIAVDNAKKQ